MAVPQPQPPQPQNPDARMLWRWAASAAQPGLGWVLVGLGALALLLGWIGLSREVLVSKQLPYLISGGFGGLALIFMGAKLLSSQDLRRYDDRLHRLETLVLDLRDLLLVERQRQSTDGGAGPALGNGSNPTAERESTPSETSDAS